MFTGYTDQTVDVFWGIRFNNDRAWFAEHKQEFQDAVMTPTKALAGELYDWFQETYPNLHLNVHISRIYRDARRLFGRGPLNDHIWFSFQNAIENRGEAPCFWFQVGADGYGCAHGDAAVALFGRGRAIRLRRGLVDAGSIRRTAAADSGQRPEARRKAPAAAGRAAGIYAFRPRLCKAEGPCRGTGWKTL